MRIMPSEQQKEKNKLKINENNLRDCSNCMKCTNICIIGRRRERDVGLKCVWWNYGWKFTSLKKETDIHIQQTQRIPNKMNSNGPKQRHIIIKMANVKHKERILKETRKKKSHIRGNHHKTISWYFSAKILQTRRYWTNQR